MSKWQHLFCTKLT